jgi:hypothetical protein
MNNLNSTRNKIDDCSRSSFVKFPILPDGFDSRALSTTELKEDYLKHRESLLTSLWCSWPRVMVILAWVTAALGFAGLMILTKFNPEAARSIIDFFRNW